MIGDIVGLEIPFLADLDGDDEVDAIGRVTLFDPAGQPIMPITNDDLQNDVDMLLAALATLPDGTRIELSFDPIAERGVTIASFSMTMQNGAPTDLGGVLNQQNVNCATAIQFADETILSVLGEYPNLTAGTEIVSGDDTVAGTIFFNGTSMATVEVTLNGIGPFQYQIDLDTGVITPTGG